MENGSIRRVYPPSGSRKRKNLTKLFQSARKVVKRIHDDPRAIFFLKPVDEMSDGALNYYQIIKQPMDLGSVLTYIDCDEYRAVEEVKEDVAKVWQNCRTYNGHCPWGNTVSKILVIWADLLEHEFEEDWEREMFPKPQMNPTVRWLRDRKILQKYIHNMPDINAHQLLCLASAGSPDCCSARRFGSCALRCEINVLQMNNATVRACTKFIKNSPNQRPTDKTPILAWPRDQPEDLTYDDEQFS
eukprot:TRINITY_DN8975_c0_g3_i1.p1 TRINITY_DN8975_c0_g3~~TRINITY_DN8975_c0_g3_i1.p1  ORF type:complete len:244 (+),score=24.73 TRINITY_DN8975_c0_g3_i1:77-808(+)